ncbi:hypothetical protein [Paenibacillus vini]|uniref:Uncharacterized protein n=1 Tax=Paenibacillus vini TaxID=1476024 RepID=A0ABQ4MAA9_9BACL|nr:hypothetical protein [Paenibacillus vini]GIP52934.1 hypothetical protein J42TS3_19690 [Paenibacillus vini]
MKALVAKLNTKQKVQNVLLEVGADSLMIVIGISVAHIIKTMMF